MIFAWLACRPEPPEPRPEPSDDPASHTGGALHTGEPARHSAHSGGPTGDTGPEPLPWDCEALPPAPLSVSTIDTIDPSEDFAFDLDGNLVSHSGTFLWKSARPPAAPVAWVPTAGSSGGPASMRTLSNGDLVYHNVDTGTLYRVTPAGAETVVFSGFGYAGGIEIGADDVVYVVDLNGIHRIDPDTGDEVRFARTARWSGPNGIALSLDRTTLFVSSREGIWSMPMDAQGLPAADPTPWAQAPPGVTEELGMGVDACGNVYVLGNGRLFRYPPEGGDPEVVFEDAGSHLTNLQWGSGIGGWSDTHLFLVNQRSVPAFTELDLGVGARPR